MNFEFSGPYSLSFLLKNFLSKQTLFNWFLANRFFMTLQVLLSSAVTGVLQLPWNSHFCAQGSEGPSALTTQSPEQPQKPKTLKNLEERKIKFPEYSVCPKRSLRSSSPVLSSPLLSSFLSSPPSSSSFCWQSMKSINTLLTQLWSKADSSGSDELFVLSGLTCRSHFGMSRLKIVTM